MRTQALQYINNPCPDVTRTYYTDGSSNDQRVGAAFVTEERQISIRLNDDATVLDAKMTAIFAALVDALDHGVVPVIQYTQILLMQCIEDYQKTDEHHSAQHSKSGRIISEETDYQLGPSPCWNTWQRVSELVLSTRSLLQFYIKNLQMSIIDSTK